MNKNVIQQDYNVSVEHRRKQNKHNSLLIWFTGLSGSGKSTLINQTLLPAVSKAPGPLPQRNGITAILTYCLVMSGS